MAKLDSETKLKYRRIGDGCLIPVDETAGLMIQFAKCVLSYSSQYGNTNSVSYTVSNLAGEPRVYPKYGDYTVACVFRTYGLWWRQLPSASKPYLRTPPFFHSEDFVELSLATPVVPLKIAIYEIYNPGSVVRILAYDASCGTNVDTGHQRWVTLWSGGPEKCPPRSRTFSPPLKEVSFTTTLIRLEFDHSLEDYYTELDAVLVIGRPDPRVVVESKSEEESSKDRELWLDREKLWKRDPLPWSAITLYLVEQGLELLLASERGTKQKVVERAVTDSSSTKDSGGTESGYFALLTEELIRLILTYLDLPSLCKLAQTCRLLQHYTYDPLLYTEVNLQPYWPMVSGETLLSLRERCTKTQRLSLAWCGNAIRIETPSIIGFFEDCGNCLRELNLSCFNIMSDCLLVEIFKRCPVLTELDLSNSEGAEDTDVMKLVVVPSFRKLQRLVLYNTTFTRSSVVAMISNLPELRHLNLGSCICIDDFTEVAVRLATNCRQLESLDLWRARSLNSFGLEKLASSCPNLQEIDLGWCINLPSSTQCFQHLAKHCPKLKKIFLTAIRSVNDHDIFAIADNCHDLQQLDILGTGEVTAFAVSRLLESCRSLVFLDVSFCSGISTERVQGMRAQFPRVDIKKSFQGEG